MKQLTTATTYRDQPAKIKLSVIFGFILLFIIYEQAGYFINPYPIDLVSMLSHYTTEIIFFFISFKTLAAFNTIKYPVIYLAVSAILLTIIFVGSKICIGELLRLVYNTDNNFYLKKAGIYLTVRRSFYILSFSTIYVYSSRNNQIRNEAIAAKSYRENMILDLQNALMRAQINPHLFANTLNYSYATIKLHPEKAQLAIELLSRLMEYASEEVDTIRSVPLYRELEQVENCIELYKLRFDQELQLHYRRSTEQAVNELMIPPLILVTFIENLFKYGNFINSEHPVQIIIQCEGNQLKYYSRNLKAAQQSKTSSGIGMKNTIKRLNYLYPNAYDLQIKDDGQFYELDFQITL